MIIPKSDLNLTRVIDMFDGYNENRKVRYAGKSSNKAKRGF
jgi:hypothetical protein